MSTSWIAAGVISAVAHLGFAAWVENGDPAPKPLPRIEMELAKLPPPKLPEPPPPPPPPPKLIEVPKLVNRISTPPPPPQTRRVGVTEAATTEKGEVTVATGVTTDGVIGTGTSMDRDLPPPPPAPPAPPPPPPSSPPKVKVFPSFEVTKLPKPRHRVQPDVPAAFRDAQREALVVVEVVIDASGRVIDARVLRHAEYGLDDAALAAAKQTDFEPALVGTQPVTVRYTIPYRFTVRG